MEVIAARNQVLPQLDVGASYRWFGMGDQLINADRNGLNYPAVGSTAFDELTEGDFQEAGIFFSFQLPVGFRRELAGVRNAQLGLTREKARLEDMELNTSHLLTRAMRGLDFQAHSAQTQFNRWQASQTEVESREVSYKAGKTTLDLVLDAQRRRATAQIDYYRALCEYNKAISEVHFRKGSLLEYNSIYLSEGPWPDKAYWDALGHARRRDASYYLDYGATRPNVIGLGPADQHGSGPQHAPAAPFSPTWEPPASLETEGGPLETVPTPAGSPADPAGTDQAAFGDAGLLTLPPGSGPADQVQGTETSATAQITDAYEWGGLGLTETSGEGLSEGLTEGLRQPGDKGNPLRHVAYEEAADVQQ